MDSVRQVLTDSWRAFLANATPAVLAGHFLERANGDASLALTMVKPDPMFRFSVDIELVRSHLRAVAREDRDMRDLQAEKVTAIRRPEAT